MFEKGSFPPMGVFTGAGFMVHVTIGAMENRATGSSI